MEFFIARVLAYGLNLVIISLILHATGYELSFIKKNKPPTFVLMSDDGLPTSWWGSWGSRTHGRFCFARRHATPTYRLGQE